MAIAKSEELFKLNSPPRLWPMDITLLYLFLSSLITPSTSLMTSSSKGFSFSPCPLKSMT